LETIGKVDGIDVHGLVDLGFARSWSRWPMIMTEDSSEERCNGSEIKRSV
jgi:hypothetical protein